MAIARPGRASFQQFRPPSQLNHVDTQEGNDLEERSSLFFSSYRFFFLFYSEDRITVCKHPKVIRSSAVCQVSTQETAGTQRVPAPRAGDLSCADEEL